MSKFYELFETRNYEQLTGNDVVKKLSEMSQDKKVYFAVILGNQHKEAAYPVNSFFSWRGSYDQPSIWSEGETAYTCGQLIEKLNDFFESEQQGYKGGTFAMSSEDRLWCDPEGMYLERGVRDVIEDDAYIFIVVDQYTY